mgnify:CR=1 FL=1
MILIWVNCCKREYINELDLIEQFIGPMVKIDLDELSIKQNIKEEIHRGKKFNQALLDIKETTEVKDIDIRNYVKYILKSGRYWDALKIE